MGYSKYSGLLERHVLSAGTLLRHFESTAGVDAGRRRETWMISSTSNRTSAVAVVHYLWLSPKYWGGKWSNFIKSSIVHYNNTWLLWTLHGAPQNMNCNHEAKIYRIHLVCVSVVWFHGDATHVKTWDGCHLNVRTWGRTPQTTATFEYTSSKLHTR
jgi:hypothetical protein